MIDALSFVVELQQELLGRKERQAAELMEVFLVVRHHHVASGSQSTLVLQHVLKVLDRVIQGDIQLGCIARKNGDR